MRAEFHGMVVSLYADYGPLNLLQFLKSSDSYPMQEAMEVCSQRKMYPEMIYLLGKSTFYACLNFSERLSSS